MLSNKHSFDSNNYTLLLRPALPLRSHRGKIVALNAPLSVIYKGITITEAIAVAEVIPAHAVIMSVAAEPETEVILNIGRKCPPA